MPKHLGFRIVTPETARSRDLLILPEWASAGESIPVETPPGVLREPGGNPKLYTVPKLRRSDRLMDKLELIFHGHRILIDTDEGSEQIAAFPDLQLFVTIEGNTVKSKAKIRIAGLPADSFTVLKCGMLPCEKLMAVPLSFWGRSPINLIIDPAIYPPSDRRSAFLCWNHWIPRALRSEPGDCIDPFDDDEMAKLDAERRRIRRIRRRRPAHDEWFKDIV